jgi:GNAT superfamily N-acetyltransferase
MTGKGLKANSARPIPGAAELRALLLSFSFRLREGRAADIPAISRAYAQSWRETYQGIAPAPFLEGMTEAASAQIFQQSFQPNSFSYFLYVVEVEGEIVGFVDGGKERGRPESGEGEIYAIYLLKPFQGKGIGRELFRAALGRLRQSGLSPTIVWVLEKNPYRRFYESLSGKIMPRVKTLDATGEKINLVSYTWE